PMKSLRERTLEIMEGYADAKVREATGHNDGEQINKFQDLLDLREGTATKDGDKYCVAALIYSLTKAQAERMDLEPTMHNLEEKALPALVHQGTVKATGG